MNPGIYTKVSPLETKFKNLLSNLGVTGAAGGWYPGLEAGGWYAAGLGTGDNCPGAGAGNRGGDGLSILIIEDDGLSLKSVTKGDLTLIAKEELSLTLNSPVTLKGKDDGKQ